MYKSWGIYAELSDRIPWPISVKAIAYIQIPLGSLCLIRPRQSRLVLQEELATSNSVNNITDSFRMNIILL
jgi:hypothetical protein